MVLPFNVDVDIMCDKIYRRLNALIQPYYEAALTAIPGYPDLKPVETAEVEWSFCGQRQTHRTTFHIVRDLDIRQWRRDCTPQKYGNQEFR
ncbi:uncharacterized protein BO72DRAFT_492118 [Aspergillus fijiensis CBS 313.89]|uniref:Uncharacterized protein n=1 Tax=Aspergillus fijiensis CBS 313.89 TaxID=1448319 RepID=A0A8G1RYF7_9EURO|nr:uncharacterized protein BO72DRAFT_492118 [Aspergillus fijiensis CBS 313.89]RAK81890.1 hypothetical protein BO72DRAFT_492118 [Aspergillus fijiensis CBS 313.89]